jgi:GT2 family glycosyltransferase
MNKTSIIIPVYNNFSFTKACINDLMKLKSNVEIIIVDNNSTDDTQNLHEHFKDIKIIKNKENLGFAKACNIGYKESTGDFVIFLNNDIRVKSNYEHWIDVLLQQDCLTSPNGGLLDANCGFIKETKEYKSGYFYLSGWCLAGDKKTFDKLIINNYKGPFSEEFGIAYFEDTDLSFRARLKNIKLKIADVPVHHFGKMTSSKVGLSSLYTTAKQIFIKKWHGKMPMSEFV